MNTPGFIDEQIRQRFELSWQRGSPVAIADLLPKKDDPSYLATLEELVHIDIEFRGFRQQENPTADLILQSISDYVDQFPELSDSAIIRRLIQQDMHVRRECRLTEIKEIYASDFANVVADVNDIDKLFADSQAGFRSTALRVPIAEEVQTVTPSDTDTSPGEHNPSDPLRPEDGKNNPTQDDIRDEALHDTGPAGLPKADTAREMPTIMPSAGEVAGHENETLARPVGGIEESVVGSDVVSGYDLLGELGRGGMGVVYKARDQKLKRIVALKMILSGGLASESDLLRFQIEAEAVAKLQHPNIVQIYEVSEHEGRPYIAFEYADGGSLDGKIAGKPQDIQEAVQLVEKLADAMQLAHENNIIHRDLKPANILLTDTGVPRISDFGLAKRLDDDSSQTEAGSIMGSPSYMAPEQAGGKDVVHGPAADTYALGAILYHLITGRPPFQAATSLDTIMQVISDEPVSPRKLVPAIPVDIETICLKCLQKEIPRRYDSCKALLEDLQHFQAGEPISARPITIIERSWKWAKRRPAVASLISVSVVALLVLIVGGTWYNAELEKSLSEATTAKRHESAQRIIAENAKEIAEVRRVEAIENLRKARKVVDTSLTGISEIIRYYPGVQRVREGLLEEVAKEYEEFAAQQGEDFEIQLERATAYVRLGEVRQTLGELDAAEVAYKNADSIFFKMNETFGTRMEVGVLAATAKIKHAGILETRGEVVGAIQMVQDILKKLRPFLEDRENALQAKVVFGNALFNLSAMYLASSNYASSEQYATEALVFYGKAVKETEISYRLQLGLANTLNVLGTIDLEKGKLSEAYRHFEKGYSVLSQLLENDPDKIDYLQSQAMMAISKGVVARHLGDTRGELAAYQEALQSYRSLDRALPDVPEFRENTALTLTDIGQLYIQTTMLSEAQVVLDEAYATFKELAIEHGEVLRYVEEFAATGEALSRCYFLQGDHQRAVSLLNEANDLFRKLSEAAPNTIPYRFRYALGLLLAANISSGDGTPEEYVQQSTVGITALEELVLISNGLPRFTDALAKGHAVRGNVLFDFGKTEEAQVQWSKALEAWHQMDLEGAPVYVQYNYLRFIVDHPQLVMFATEKVIRLATLLESQSTQIDSHLRVLAMLLQLKGDNEEAALMFERGEQVEFAPSIYPPLASLLIASKTSDQDSVASAMQELETWKSRRCPGNIRLARLFKRYARFIQPEQ